MSDARDDVPAGTSDPRTTDAELLLRQCLEAFRAIPVAARARKMLGRLGVRPLAYAGNGSHLLAEQMATEILRHFKTYQTAASVAPNAPPASASTQMPSITSRLGPDD